MPNMGASTGNGTTFYHYDVKAINFAGKSTTSKTTSSR
jgi:hypothetical protein